MIHDDDARLGAVQAAYDRGLYLDAHALARPLGPLASWRGASASVLAARLASILGAPTLAQVILRRARREHPADDRVAYFVEHWSSRRRPPAETVARLRARRPAPHVLPDWLALEAAALALLRDFGPAHELLDEAEALDPKRAWPKLERSHVLMAEDRPEEALDVVRGVLALRPQYRPAFDMLGGILVALGRDDEAFAELARAGEALQYAGIHWQCANLLVDARRFMEARRELDRYERLAPLNEPRGLAALASRRSDIAAWLGEREESLAQASRARSSFHRAVVEHARSAPPDARRVVLDVPFVRQQHLTCAPATLTALARYWGHHATHLEIVEEICYDGTSMDAERHWAESNGFVVREFNVTWQSAIALIERGLPFTLATVEPGTAHLQAVIGFDAIRGTLLLRDPSHRSEAEMLAGAGLDRYRFTGPRGLVMVPLAKADLLEGLSLPDEPLRNRHYLLLRALRRHDRAAAMEQLDALEREAPDHDLVLMARLSLAAYDEDEPGRLRALEELSRRHDKQAAPLLWELAARRNLSSGAARAARLEGEAARPSAHPHVLVQLANDLLEDARQHDRAERLLRRALRRAPCDPWVHATLADLHSARRRPDEALSFHRWAACLDDRNEGRSRTWFAASSRLGRSEEAIDTLRRRFERLGARSHVPARALVSSLLDLERTAEAVEILAEARRLRADDGELLLHAARVHVQIGDAAHAARCVEEARGRVAPRQWLTMAALLAQLRGEPAEAIALHRRVLEIAPAAVDTHDAMARLLAASLGPQAALEHLASACARFPHHRALLRRRLAWLGRWAPEARAHALREAIAQEPNDAWIRRELALDLARAGRHPEAFDELERAAALDPGVSTWTVRAHLLESTGRMREAREALREAVRLDSASEWTIARLLALPADPETRRADLDFVEGHVTASPGNLDGLAAWREQAAEALPPDEVVARLRAIHSAHPHAWQAWSELVLHLGRCDMTDEALGIAGRAVERFPHLPVLLLVRSVVERSRGDHEAARRSLEEALRRNPAYEEASVALADVHRRSGAFDAELRVLQAAMIHAPHRGPLVSRLVARLLRQGRAEEAAAALRRFVDADPQADPDWGIIEAAARDAGQLDTALEIAREIARRRPGLASSWMAVAEVAGGRVEERLDALRRAVALAPAEHDPRDLLAAALASLGRFDEARAAVRTQEAGIGTIRLEGRAAWIEWQSGRRVEAFELMRDILRRDPQYAWGWWCLQAWREQIGDVPGRREALEALARLRPGDGWVLKALGALREAAGDSAGARAALQRAVDLAPHDPHAARSLVAACLSAGDHEAALAAAERVRTHLPEGAFDAWRAWIELTRGDFGAAIAAIGAAASVKDLASDHVAGTLRAARKRWGADEFLSAVERLVVGTPGNENLAAAWVATTLEAERRREALRVLHALPAGTPAWHAVLRPLLETHGPDELALRLRWTLRWNARHARSNAETWACVGFFRLNRREYGAALRWMSDWSRRETSGSWMLLNPALAAWALGRRAEAIAMSRRALASHDDDVAERHRVLLALDALLRGDLDEARELRARVGSGDMGGCLDYVRRCVEIAVAARGEGLDAAQRRARWEQARSGMAALGRPEWSLGPGLHRPMRQARAAAMLSAARECGGRSARFRARIAALLA